MCGIAGVFGRAHEDQNLREMIARQNHRGPDSQGLLADPDGSAWLGHNRLSILDLSEAGRQPMSDATGRYSLVFNGEIYNYLELREELEGYPFRSQTDSEVLLAAYAKWGEGCLDRLIGMFAFAIWDEREQVLFAARDRFGVKPLYLHEPAQGGLWLASEIKALHAAGAPRKPNPAAWATFLGSGMYDHTEQTFWAGIRQLPPGHCLHWSEESGLTERCWYDLAASVCRMGEDSREEAGVAEELLSLLEHSVQLRFRSDVPVGVCLSGGLDSSLLLALVHRVQGADSAVNTYTFFTGDPEYDETPWVEQMLARTRHPARFCRLSAADVPALAAAVQGFQDEPFGGFPTLGMAKVHEQARADGVVVLLDGNGMDEGWGGYEYYARAQEIDRSAGPVQGSRSRATRPECLRPEFRALAHPFTAPAVFGDSLRDLQYRDIRYAKIPRAMRFADRVSMMFSRELREPFLDHRIVELGLRQPADRKVRGGQGKWLPRRLAERLLPEGVREAPKRPVQTPQREWLRGPLAGWAEEIIREAVTGIAADWLDSDRVLAEWQAYKQGQSDNSLFVWQWISLGLIGRF